MMIRNVNSTTSVGGYCFYHHLFVC